MTGRSLLEDVLRSESAPAMSFTLDVQEAVDRREIDALVVGESHKVVAQHMLMDLLLVGLGKRVEQFFEEEGTFYTSEIGEKLSKVKTAPEVFDPWNLEGWDFHSDGLLVSYSGSAHAHPLVARDYQFCADDLDPFYHMTQQEEFKTVQEYLTERGRQVTTLLMFDGDNVSSDHQNKVLLELDDQLRDMSDTTVFVEGQKELMSGVKNAVIYQLRPDVFVNVSQGVFRNPTPEIIENYLAALAHERIGNYIRENSMVFHRGTHVTDSTRFAEGSPIGGIIFRDPGEHLMEIVFKKEGGERVMSEMWGYDPKAGRYKQLDML